MKMIPIIENVTLSEIIKSINIGLVNYSDETNLRILNPNKKGFVIVVMRLNIMENIVEFINDEKEQRILDYKQSDFTKLESELELFDYVVLTLESSGTTQRIVNVPLFELLFANDNLIADESGKHNITDGGWDMKSGGWSLYDTNPIENT